jgi:DNA invertase Pin-like site-specific DNA recombinase
MPKAKPKKQVAIYARVSTDKQAADMQLSELRSYVKRSKWGIYKEFIDHGYSGSTTNRPAFAGMMVAAQKKEFDILLVWKLDRLSRSLKDLITTLDELRAFGIDFISYDNQMDTSTPSGKLLFSLIGAMAEFEQEIIRERVKAGLENARRKGKTLGRPRKPGQLRQKAIDLHKGGVSNRKIGKKLGIAESTVRNWLKLEKTILTGKSRVRTKK